ncbi:MAG TPA: DUF4129 domain-containing protein [Streptomyces sp.]
MDDERAGGVARSAGAALAVLVVTGTTVAAVTLRPSGSVFGKGSGPLGGSTSLVLLLVLGWVVAGLVLAGRYRDEVRYDVELRPVAQRLADCVRYALLVAPLVFPVILLALHRFPASTPHEHRTRDLRRSPAPGPLPKVSHDRLPFGLRLVLILGLCLLVAAAVIAAIFLLRIRLRRPRWKRHPRRAAYGAAYDNEQDVLADAVDSGRRALRDGADARAAVIACYAAMEESLADSGVVRRASDSPQDLLERAAGSGLLTGQGAGALTRLFREARYSSHPMDDGHRQRAADALAGIAAQLARRAEESDTAGQDPAADSIGAAP